MNVLSVHLPPLSYGILQMVYAAHDAQISVALFFHLLGMNTVEGESTFVQLASCWPGAGGRALQGALCGEEEEGERRRRSRKSTVESPSLETSKFQTPRGTNANHWEWFTRPGNEEVFDFSCNTLL